jgi:hypothetical protein
MVVEFEIVIFLVSILGIYLSYVTTIGYSISQSIFDFVVYEVIFNTALWFWFNKVIVS